MWARKNVKVNTVSIQVPLSERYCKTVLESDTFPICTV